VSGTVYKRCPCPSGPCGQFQPLASRRNRHGSWFFALRIDTSNGRYLLRRGGYEREKDASKALDQVAELMALEKDDAVIRGKVGDLIVASSAHGGQLPDVATVRRKLGAGMDPASPDLTVAQHLEAWHATGRTVRGKPWKVSARRTYRQHIDHYLIPLLGEVPLARLRADHVAGMLDKIAEWNAEIARQKAAGKALIVLDGNVRKNPKPVSNTTVNRVYATLRTALNAAVRAKLIMFNPCSGVRPGEPEPYDYTVWSAEQMITFLEHAQASGERLTLLYRLVLVCGLRRGEVVGLRWGDLDLDAPVLRVTHAVLQLGSAIVNDTPKSRTSVRDVSLDAETVRLLRAHYDSQVLEHLGSAGAYEDGGLVFCDELGAMYSPDLVSRRFLKASKAAGLPRMRLHDGRHSSATMAMEAGIRIERVSARLGHSTTKITQDVYTHVRREVADDDAEILAAMLTRKKPSE
jgi:integrase